MKAENTRTHLFEVSWEVCNKVGGIYEVVASKALQAVEMFGDNYYLLGPDLKNNPEFIESNEGCWDILRYQLKDKELNCRCGRWNIPGNPKVILVDFAGKYNSNQLLYALWERYGLDSLSGGWDYIEPILFSHACGEVITTAYSALVAPEKGRAVAQFHEWMCGAGLLEVKQNVPEIGTIFTTHATMLGRAMAGAGVDIYAKMASISPVQEAAAYNITAKYSMESISAREADIFTTVSKITADEATVFLGRTPDVFTVNGLDMRTIPDFSSDRKAAAVNRERLLEPVTKLLRHELPGNTRIMAISGRYEFHNKGLDVFLDALARAQQDMKNSQTHILALFLVMGGHTGVNPAAISGDPNVHPDPEMPEAGFLTSHHVYDEPNDPILNACRRLGLHNREDNNVQVVFVPGLLDGHDGFFNMEYFEILSGCDLGVFPSWYEPWGYTPHESAAYGVPTITTDLSGFGLWVRDLQDKQGQRDGVTVLPRRMANYDETVAGLHKVLMEYATSSTEVLDNHRVAGRALCENASWNDFYDYYIEAYSLAGEKADQRGAMLAGARRRESLNRVLTAKSSTTPFLRMVTAVAELPPPLARLRELAYNMWWCWHPEAIALFQDMNPKSWEDFEHNPVRMIEEADPAGLTALANSDAYLGRYEQVMADFDAYMAAPPAAFGDVQPDGRGLISNQRPIAYFSTEYGLHESLTIYSGGLGVLSGDHLKSASDEGVPLVGIGLLYRNGYFRQSLDKTGRQVPVYPENDFSTLPLEALKDERDRPLEISLEMPGRTLYARIWRCQVGRVPLYLLDTNIPKNTDDDRRITARLYEADRDLRLRQEILLGMGGVRLTRKLGLSPAVFHMNEGHSAFLGLERIRQHMHDDNMALAEAMVLVAGSTVFTTHTPVDAGNERFNVELIERYFKSFAQNLGMDWQDFARLGKQDGDDPRTFDMTVLALRLSAQANAVSKLHGYVSRNMWRNIWKGLAIPEVPIGHITNGIHTSSYVAPPFRAMLDRYLGAGWLKLLPDAPEWEQVYSIPDRLYWEARRVQKNAMLEFLRDHIQKSSAFSTLGRTQRKMWLDNLSSDALIIGFARRFAPYKRATMLFADPGRLARLLGQPGKPVILLFSGKAHPADVKGIDLIQEVYDHSLDPRFQGRIFFIEDYSLAISRLLVSGCDVWLNTPRRPYEASGTSGEKVPVNGGINLSISDGWWVEGADGKNGWVIGPQVIGGVLNDDQNDYADAESLYALLEDQVLPQYFDRGEDLIPHSWINMSKRSLVTLTARYSTARMVNDYVRQIYIPAARQGAALDNNRQQLARSLGTWRQQIGKRFKAVSLEEIQIEGIEGDTLVCGQPLTVRIRLKSGDLGKEDLLAQLVIGPTDGTDFTEKPDILELEAIDSPEPGTLIYAGIYTTTHNGRFAYGIRVMPTTPGQIDPLRSDLVLWG